MPWLTSLQSANWREVSGIAVGAYLLGCFATGYYLVRLRTGQDIRELGSGSVGAKNVGRLLGRPGFVVALLGDLAKGAFAVWAAQHFTKDDWAVQLSLLAVVAGHVWPAQLRFRGGKRGAPPFGGGFVFF